MGQKWMGVEWVWIGVTHTKELCDVIWSERDWQGKSEWFEEGKTKKTIVGWDWWDSPKRGLFNEENMAYKAVYTGVGSKERNSGGVYL